MVRGFDMLTFAQAGLFQNSETLVGVMRDQGINSSRALTLDLRKYQAA